LFFYETPCFMRGFFMKTAVEGKTFCPTAAPHHITFGEHPGYHFLTKDIESKMEYHPRRVFTCSPQSDVM